MENNYIKNGNNRVENPCMTQGEGKNRGRRGREEGKKRLRREVAEGKYMNSVGIMAMMFLMLILPAWVWGQGTDYSGTWYINNQKLPDDGYYFVPTINCFYNGDEDQPHLTTFKTGQDKNSIWRIVSVTVDTETYYRIIHNATGKYLMANTAISALGNSNAHRKRVHLETLTPQDIVNLNLDPSTDKSLFVLVEISSENNIVAIKSKNVGSTASGEGTTHLYLNPRGNNSGDFDYYRAKEGRDITHTTGIVGFYGNDSSNPPSGQAGSQWKLETATSTCANPVVRYTDANTIEISYPINDDTGWTIQYTTDGSDPNTGTSITSTTTISAENVTKVRAIATKTGWNPSEESVLIASGKTQLVQSKDCEAFYMVPPIVDGDPIYATTTNIPHAKMGWSFEPAGLYCGIQYYHIINVETNEYLYCNVGSGGDNALIMKSGSDITPNPNNYNEALDRAKFRLMVQNDGSYKVISKWWAAENPNAYFVNKKNGNNGTNALNLADGNSNTALWNVIPVPTNPKTQFDASYASTTAHCYYIIIKSVTGDTYHVLPAATNNGNATANTSPDKQEWFFMPVDDNDPWTPYYQIRNGKTGEYLYFNGAAGVNNTFYTSSYVELGYEDRYKFVVVKGANSDYPDAYNIIPKALKNQANQANNSLNRNNTTLRTQNSRNTPASLWNLVQTSFQCARPVIEWRAADNGYFITASEPDASIYYLIGDGELTPSTGTLFFPETAISVADLGVETVTIRAIAARNGDGSDASDEATQTVNRVATPEFVLTDDGRVELTCSTPSVDFYYEMGATPGEPTTSSTHYTGPIENAAGLYIKAIAVKGGWINSAVATSEQITFSCAMPIIRKTSATTFTITCDFPTDGVTIYYETGVDPEHTPTPSNSSLNSILSGDAVTFDPDDLPFTVKAIAYADGYNPSAVATQTLTSDLNQDPDGYYVIASDYDFGTFVSMVNENTTNANANYKITADINASEAGVIDQYPFTGELKSVAKADGTFPVVSGLSHAIFNTVNGGTVKNVMLKGVNIQNGDSDGDAGAVCSKAMGSSRIYNCGILPTGITRDEDGNITGFSGSSVSGTRYVGGLVGLLSGTARVINCYSYANVSGGSIAAGIVGNNNESTTLSSLNTMVMNCMFYGNITGAATMKPVYGGTKISNAGATGVNNYNYYRNGNGVTFDDNYASFGDYYCSLPADEEYLTRFEYYRSIMNSNKRLCAWWINGTSGTAPTDAEVEVVGIAKWVLDPEIAPFPILKKWGKYPSVINQDKTRVWDPRTKDADGNPLTPHWVNRSSAPDYQGKQLGTINVTVNAGAKHAGTGATSKTLSSVIVMDMDTLNHDYCYAKIQLPYYNEQFGDPTADSATNWDNRYAGNYKDYVVTGWKITGITGGTAGSFKGYSSTAAADAVSAADVTPDEPNANAWEDGFNFADRKCTNKDLYIKSGRVFAQGGYYYVPEGVSDITIEAYWGKAVYLHNKNHYMDRVNVAATADGDGDDDNTGPDFGSDFTPAGTLSTTFQTYTVKDNLQDAISSLTNDAGYTVYDQAIVLVGNVQVKNRGGSLSNGSRAFTIMSCDLDLDNEPDYCLQFQTRNTTNRPPINPARFDFLPVPELGLAIRTNTFAYAIGIMVPKGHFEITETAFMHTTQFEYDANVNKTEAPLILNGGHFEQIVVRYGPKNRTSYIIMGGNFRMKRFTPGYHASNIQGDPVRHCVVNAIGGEYPEFYLSGIYRPDQATLDSDNPHCYTNGGHFGLVAGAGYEQVKGNVTFKIDHSIIREFYGGGINGAKPITGNIDVTINNSLVGKYCGGPKVGSMAYDDNGTTKYRTVTTNATGTTFGVFYGSGNGGTSYYRDPKYDNTREFPTTEQEWITQSGTYTPKFNEFTPLNQESTPAADYSDVLGYHAEYEFEVFNASNGLKSSDDVIRLYYHWAQFGSTITGDVTNTLTNCTITGDFFGGGNLGNVTGNVTSTLKGTTHVYGSAFAAGYSASIPSFPAHDKSTVRFPAKDKAGNVAEQGSLDYYQDGGVIRMYTWCYKNTTTGTVLPEGVEIPSGYDVGLKQKSAFRFPDEDGGKWYILTNVSLENLGAVSGNATITIDDNSVIDHDVFGGGDASAVNGNTTVKLQGNAHVYGNVFGGGNEGPVGGNSEVRIE